MTPRVYHKRHNPHLEEKKKKTSPDLKCVRIPHMQKDFQNMSRCQTTPLAQALSGERSCEDQNLARDVNTKNSG